MQAKTMSQVDEWFIAPMYGYPTVDHYYRDASNIGKLHKIYTPYVCLAATDDLFIAKKCKDTYFVYIC